MKKLLRAIGLLLGAVAPLMAGPTGPPAGRFIQLTNTLQSGATFFVSSGTVAGPMYTNSLNITGITNGQCLQSGPGGQVFGTGFACGGGAGSFIGNQNTLQSGATFYVSSGTVQGNFYVIPSGNFSSLYLTPGTFSTPATVGSIGNLELDAGSIASETFYQGTHNGVPGPSGQVAGNLSLNGTGQNVLYFRQQNTGFNYIGFVASQTVTGTTFVLPNADGTSGQAMITDGNHNLSFGTIAGTSIYAATATASFPFGQTGSTFSYIGPTPSTVTYGLVVGSLTVSGIPGQAGSWQAIEGTTPSGTVGYITLTADTTGPALKMIVDAGATYYVTSSSVAPTAGHIAGWGPGGLGQLVDAGPYPLASPGGPTGAIQYNAGAGAFGGSNNWQIFGGSITVISSMSVTTAGGRTNTSAGYFDVFHSTAFLHQVLFSVGDENNSGQFSVPDQNPAQDANYGIQGGHLIVGGAASGNSTIQNNNFGNGLEEIDMGTTSGQMVFKTPTSFSGDLFMVPNASTVAVFDAHGITLSSSMTVIGPGGTSYIATFSTSATTTFIDISSTAHINSPITSSVIGTTVTSCGTLPVLTGNDVAGTISTSGSVTACTLTFGKPYINTPVCTESDNSTAITADITSISNTAVTFGFSSSLGTGKIWYICIGSD